MSKSNTKDTKTLDKLKQFFRSNKSGAGKSNKTTVMYEIGATETLINLINSTFVGLDIQVIEEPFRVLI